MKKMFLNKSAMLMAMGGLLLIVVLVGCSDNSAKVDSLDNLVNDQMVEKDIEGDLESLGYESLNASSEGQKYAFMKASDKMIEPVYNDDEVAEYTFYFVKDFSKEEGNQVNLVLNKKYDTYEYNISVYDEEENTILVEKQSYYDCSKGECNSDRYEFESSFDKYLYNVDEDELAPIGDIDEDNKIKLGDVKDDLTMYFDEMMQLYDSK